MVGFMRRYDDGLPRDEGGARRRARSAPRCCTTPAHRNPAVPPSVTTDGVSSSTPACTTSTSRAGCSTPRSSPRRCSAPAAQPAPRSTCRTRSCCCSRLANGVLVDIEAAVNIAYGYDIRGEVARRDAAPIELAESGRDRRQARGRSSAGGCRPTGASGSSAPTTSSSRSGSTRSPPDSSTGPSSWDGYAATVVVRRRRRGLNTAGAAGDRCDARAAGPLPATAGTGATAPTERAATMVKIALDPAMYHAAPLGGRRGAQGRGAGLRVPGALAARGLVLLAPLPEGRRRRRSPRCARRAGRPGCRC